MKTLVSSALIVGAIAFGAAHAAPVIEITDPTEKASFTSFSNGGAGVQGAELRGGNGQLNGTWEVGFGQQTSQSGTFVQNQFVWTETPTGQDFVYSISGAGVGNFQLIRNNVVEVNLTWNASAMQLGNSIEFFAKRLAEMTITEVEGMAVNFSLGDITSMGSEALILYSEDFLDGFEIKGTLGLVNGRNSAYGIVMKAGNVTLNPVPVPAAGLLFAGAAGIGAIRRLRRS